MPKDTIEKILTELENIKKIIQHASETGRFPDIEKDITLSKLRNIYEFIYYIQPGFDIEPKEETATNPATAEEIKKKVEIVEKSFEKTDVLEIKLESTTKIPENTTHFAKTDEILAEKLRETGEFMNEVLSRYANTFDISKKLQNQPISDISIAIGLNDKFLFIKELFHNDSDLYKKTIDTLNNASDFNNAIQYIDSNFKWDFENPSVQKLLELIRRRHPSL